MNAARESPGPKASPVNEAQIISDLPREQRNFLFKSAVRRRYAKGNILFAPGDRSSFVYYIIRGRVKISNLTGEGEEIIFRFCGPHNLFGLSTIFGGQAREVFAHAVADTEVHCIRRESLEKLTLRNPRFAIDVIHVLGHRLRQAHSAITEFAVGDVRSRIAQLLEKFAQMSSTTKDGVVHIDNKFTHQDMAHMIGATRTTVTKVINDWKRRGLIRIARGRIVILDYPAIRALIHR
jgi:CRP/FNR family transcriptional regulator